MQEVVRMKKNPAQITFLRRHASTARFVLSVLLFAFAIVFSFTVNGYTLGDHILNYFGLPAWSYGTNGSHYTLLYSLGIIIIAYLCKPMKAKKLT